MSYPFVIEPETYSAFEDEDHQIEKCKEWGLLSEKASRIKSFVYKRNRLQLACSIVGFVDQTTAVIEFDNKQKHCIHPAYLKEMQAAQFSQRLGPAAEEESVKPEVTVSAAAVQEEAPAVAEAEANAAALNTDEPGEAATSSEALPKEKAKKAKTQKIQLPEEKVKMSATVAEFTTVPNHFSDTEDEVVIYEAVTIEDPFTELGAAWSSRSATLKKLELEIGDTITFEAKIVAKKLTRHPVPYKINNPAKIQKKEAGTE
ncbi:hypothetical protein [Paenibacillus rigui]|uniref:Uncharacterized protein n=1 Tax=Paenibacillus rigui TaxID=554312 RepID=A0A229UT46_9BACL|nr:hypothetical protein [Paenibacillus rigui]OXM86572.1 hypothetical protein CF651_08945 [Paenibacillus rigui]